MYLHAEARRHKFPAQVRMILVTQSCQLISMMSPCMLDTVRMHGPVVTSSTTTLTQYYVFYSSVQLYRHGFYNYGGLEKAFTPYNTAMLLPTIKRPPTLSFLYRHP
jgi:hypothetical protein